MQNKIIKIGVVSFVVVFTILSVYSFFVNDSHAWPLGIEALKWALGVALLIMLLYKILYLRKERQLRQLLVDVGTDEKIILEGPANSRQPYTIIEGKLLLTCERLIFKTNSSSQDNFSLNQISAIKVKKTLGVLEDCLWVSINGTIQKFIVDYPGDWKTLIECQKVINEKVK